MSAYFKTVTVPAAYTAAPDADLQFEPSQLILRSATGSAFFSFDGVTDHGHISGGVTEALNRNLYITTKQRKVWLKQDGGAATVRVMAFTAA